MKNQNGMITINVIFVSLIAILTAGATLFILSNTHNGVQSKHDNVIDKITSTTTQSSTTNKTIESSTTSNTTETIKTAEDGTFMAYIDKIYDVNGKTFLYADYYRMLYGKDAVHRRLNDTPHCWSGDMTKEQILSIIDSMSDDLKAFNTEYENKVKEETGLWNCFPSGVGMSVNDNPKIRTFEVALQNPIYMAQVREKYGQHTENVGSMSWTVSLETLKKIISNVSYKIKFSISVLNNKVIKINEIYES